jgi:T5SS/PEP-CTERM-associated repeat protein
LGNNNLALLTDAGTFWSNRNHLTVGNFSVGNQLVVSNGAVLHSGGSSVVGANSSASSNAVTLTGLGSKWAMASGTLFLGSNSPFNRLVITNGARLDSPSTEMGDRPTGSNNLVIVTDPGSLWTNRFAVFVGAQSDANRLVVTNGGQVQCQDADVGLNRFRNEAMVTDAGSLLSATSDFRIGPGGGDGSQLVVSNNGTVTAGANVTLGPSSGTPSSNLLTVVGGTLRATNSGGTALLNIRSGNCLLSAGMIEADQLLLTNTAGFFEFNGGTLSVKGITVNNGQVFRVGNGGSPATFAMAGNGTHSFSNGLAISTYGSLVGNGTIVGALTVEAGGTFAPGASVGKIVLSNSPSLQGHTRMEISKSGATLTNDQIQVTAALTYGGELTISNLGPTALALGDRFPLFSATSYGGAFSVVTLPSPPVGLNWTNKLLVDGSIEVIAGPKFTGVSLSGTNVIISGTGGTPNAPYAVLTATNVITPLSNWVSIATNLFDSSGNFSFTNGIAPEIPQRFFRIRSPVDFCQ